jgi:quinol monooxygenase YgiN
MIVVAGTVSIRPDKREEAIRVGERMQRLTENEAGCLSYRFYSSISDPNRFFIFEEWADEAALAAHFQTEHMAWFREQLPAFVAGEMAIKRYEVSATEMM